MKKVILLLVLIGCLGGSKLFAQQLDADVCGHRSTQSVFLPKNGTTTLFAAGANGTYVCGFGGSGDPLSNTPQVLELFYGTGSTCSGSPVYLTGALSVTSSTPFSAGNAGYSLFYIPAGNNLCYNTGNIQGWVTYVNP
jgi:hypothetical protein